MLFIFSIVFLFVVLLVYDGKCVGSDFKQEQAKVIFTNPKYIKDVFLFTSRDGRRSPYLTSVNCTTLEPYGNNVTYRMELTSSMITSFPFAIEFTCDTIRKMVWLADWIKSGSNMPLNRCPLPPGTYYFRKMPFPPKNFPMAFSNVDYYAKFLVLLTATRERIAETAVNMRYHSRG